MEKSLEKEAKTISMIPTPEEPYNCGQQLTASLDARGEGRVLRCAGRDCSGRELAARVRGLQAALLERGLEPGDRVLLLLRDTPAFYAAFLGAMRAGLVPIPVSTLLRGRDVAFIGRDAGVRAALVDDALPDDLRRPEVFPEDAAVLLAHDQEIEGVATPSGKSDPEPFACRADDEAFWLYTSGTTGEPKGVVHRHLDIPMTAELYARQVLEMTSGDRVLSAAKLFFAYGLGNSLSFPLLLGAEAVLHPERPTPVSMFELIEREQPTLFFGVPTLYAAMLDHPELPESLGSVRLCVSAGEALAASLFERWRERFGVEILDGLGSTEMLHIFVSNRPGEVRPGTSGRPVPGYEVRLVDENGHDVAAGELGTLLAHGESAARRCHERPEVTASTMFAPGWLRSGDSYRRDADGYLTHEGRADDLMKVSGQYVSPIEVEATLAAHPAVVEAAVVAREDDNRLIKPMAYVVLAAGQEPSDDLAAELQQFVKERIAPYKYPRFLEFTSELPKTATGKIKRFELRERARR